MYPKVKSLKAVATLLGMSLIIASHASGGGVKYPVRASALERLQIAPSWKPGFLLALAGADLSRAPKRFRYPTILFVNRATRSVVYSSALRFPCSDMSGQYGAAFDRYSSEGRQRLFSLSVSETESEDRRFKREYMLLRRVFRRLLLDSGYEPVANAGESPPVQITGTNSPLGWFIQIEHDNQTYRFAVRVADGDDHPDVRQCGAKSPLVVGRWAEVDDTTYLEVDVPTFVMGCEGDGRCTRTPHLLTVRPSASGITVGIDGREVAEQKRAISSGGAK